MTDNGFEAFDGFDPDTQRELRMQARLVTQLVEMAGADRVEAVIMICESLGYLAHQRALAVYERGYDEGAALIRRFMQDDYPEGFAAGIRHACEAYGLPVPESVSRSEAEIAARREAHREEIKIAKLLATPAVGDVQ